MEELSYVGPYLIGHFTGESELAVVLLTDPDTLAPLISKEELRAIETCVEKESAVRTRATYYYLFEVQDDPMRELYLAEVSPLVEAARLARNSAMEAVVHEDLYAGEFKRVSLCYGLVTNTSLAPFMHTYTATDPYIVVKAKSSTIIFKQTKENILATLVRETNLVHVAQERVEGEGKQGETRVFMIDV